MDRIQRALDLSKLPAQSVRNNAPTEEDPRIERMALNREFSLGTVESVARLPVNWSACKEKRIVPTLDVQAAGHAYRMLRTQVLQRARTHGLSTVGVVSAVNGEGKTLTAINLALSLAAEPNQSVVLVDFDLRRPAIARTLGLSVEQGLEAWFATDMPTKNVCYGLEGVERLQVLPTMAPVHGSSEVLAGLATRKLLNELQGREPGRLVLVDLPPVLLSDDALMVAPLLDGVVLVVHERRTRREDVVRVMELLGNTKVIGTVLNRSSESETRTETPMYEKYYALREKPFALTPDPAFLYPAQRYRHALTMLQYALSQATGFALITGEVGCGKTTVVRHFLERTAEQLNVAFITNAYPGFGPLLPWVMESLSLEVGAAGSSELYRRFVSHVKQVYAKGVRTVLVIDEAQNLGVEGLEELRVLSNLNAGKDLCLQTVLIGQPELRQTLRLQNLRQFAQRIVIDHHLEALNLEETIGYVRHRLTVAGGRSDLFEPEALQRVYESSGGVPRLVNLICDTALVYGFADQRPDITIDLIDLVIADRTAGGLLPLRAAGSGTQGSLATA